MRSTFKRVQQSLGKYIFLCRDKWKISDVISYCASFANRNGTADDFSYIPEQIFISTPSGFHFFLISNRGFFLSRSTSPVSLFMIRLKTSFLASVSSYSSSSKLMTFTRKIHIFYRHILIRLLFLKKKYWWSQPNRQSNLLPDISYNII